MALGRSATGATIAQPMDPWHRRGGLLAAVGSLLLSLRYGWELGWLGAVAGYASGMLGGLVAAALTAAFRRERPRHRNGGVALGEPFELQDERHVHLIDQIRKDYSWRRAGLANQLVIRLMTTGETIRQPLGVCAVITPYNFPVMIPVWFWPYAVGTGNTVVLKPSEQDPLTHQLVVKLAVEAGLPPDVLNVVHGGREAVSALLFPLRRIPRVLLRRPESPGKGRHRILHRQAGDNY